MKKISSSIFKLSIVLALFLSGSFFFGQEIINNNQTETIKLPVNKIVSYFNNFNNHYQTDYQLKETKLDSITQNKNTIILYLTENKNYESALIFTDMSKYQKTMKEKSFETNLLMLFKGEYNAETLKHPIKPSLRDSFSKNGKIKWKIKIEAADGNSAKLTFIFDSLDESSKQKFITDFAEGIDSHFNYTIQKIFVAENFKRDILNYLTKSSNSDATDVQPTKGN